MPFWEHAPAAKTRKVGIIITNPIPTKSITSSVIGSMVLAPVPWRCWQHIQRPGPELFFGMLDCCGVEMTFKKHLPLNWTSAAPWDSLTWWTQSLAVCSGSRTMFDWANWQMWRLVSSSANLQRGWGLYGIFWPFRNCQQLAQPSRATLLFVESRPSACRTQPDLKHLGAWRQSPPKWPAFCFTSRTSAFEEPVAQP